MESLPDEILWMIFDHLTTLELRAGPVHVCQRWARLVSERVCDVRSCADLESLSANPRGLVALHISTRIDFLHRLLWAAALVCPQLRELTALACSPLADDHVRLLARLTGLRHVDVFRAGGAVDVALLAAVAGRVRRLILNDRLPRGRLATLATTAHRLCGLHLYGRASYYPVCELHAVLRARRDHLRELTLRCMELTNKSAAIIADCSNLESLQLYSCWMFTIEGVTQFTRLSRLKKLHVTGLKMVHRVNLGKWLSILHLKLVELNLSSTSFCDEHVSIIIRQFPGLRTLELWKCLGLTPIGILHLTKGLMCLRNLDLNSELTSNDIKNIAQVGYIERLRCIYSAYNIEASDNSNYGENDIRDVKQLKLSKQSQNNGVTTCKQNSKVNKKSGQDKCNMLNVGSMQVQDCTARFARKYFRGTGEGFRANLFYYSLQDIPLEPLPHYVEEHFDYVF